MSHYVEVKSQFKDQAALVEALEELFGSGSVEVHSTPVPIAGWNEGEGPIPGEPSNIVVRRATITRLLEQRGLATKQWGADSFFVSEKGEWVGLADIGFRRNADGTFSQFIDHCDAPLLQALPQRYARAATIRQAKAQGYTVAEQRAADGTIKLQLSKWGSP